MVYNLGVRIEEVAIYLRVSARSIQRYLSKYLALGKVASKKLGGPICSLSMHPHIEFIIMEVLLSHPDKTLAEIVHTIYQETGDELQYLEFFTI